VTQVLSAHENGAMARQLAHLTDWLIVIVCLTAINSLGTAVKNAFYQIYNSVVAVAPS
jgi:Flp pilus assembly pilin Flp